MYAFAKIIIFITQHMMCELDASFHLILSLFSEKTTKYKKYVYWTDDSVCYGIIILVS